MDSMDGKDVKVSMQALATAPNCHMIACYRILRAFHAFSLDRCSSLVCKMILMSHHAAYAARFSIDERQRAL